MPHHNTLLDFLPIFITLLLSYNTLICRASRLLPLKPESPTPSTSKPPPPHHEWPLPQLQRPKTNLSEHEHSNTQPKSAKFPPWLQDPTKAQKPTPPDRFPPPKFEEPSRPQPNIHELQPFPKPKWQRPIPEVIPKGDQKPAPKKPRVLALPPSHEMPSLLISPESAPMPSVAVAPSSAQPKHA